MPTRKQRRRREKERRHEYEYVYVDDEGREVDVESTEVDEDRSGRNGKDREKPKPEPKKSRDRRPVREVQPPSWTRVGKRALIFFPLIFIAFSFVNSKQAFATRVLVTLVYTGFFIPFMYFMDRTMYRTYLRRTGRSLPPRQQRRR